MESDSAFVEHQKLLVMFQDESEVYRLLPQYKELLDIAKKITSMEDPVFNHPSSVKNYKATEKSWLSRFAAYLYEHPKVSFSTAPIRRWKNPNKAQVKIGQIDEEGRPVKNAFFKELTEG